MRDLDRVRDKIEIRLDPRQVVTLGIVTTLFCGLLFAAGFWAGRRQVRGPSAEPANLAALDAASRAVRDESRTSIPAPALGDVEFLFPAVVAAGPARGPEQAPVRVEAVVVGPAERPEPAAFEPRPVPAEPVRALPLPLPVPVPVKVAAVAPPTAPPAPPTSARMAEPPPPDEMEGTPKPGGQAAVDAASGAPPPPDEDEPKRSGTAGGTKGAYTLQVKAAREKSEADAVVEQLRKAGFEPSLVVAEVPGKGRYYRVRVGRFENVEQARAFQRKLKAESGLNDAGFVTDL